MSSIKEIKEHIESVGETRKLTNAMHLISSAKMKKAKESLEATKPFFLAMKQQISRIIKVFPYENNPYFQAIKKSQETKNIGVIVVTADKGLAGAYNHNIIKTTESLVDGANKFKLYVLGEVGRHYFENKRGAMEMEETFYYTVQNPTLHGARHIAEDMLVSFLNSELDEVYIVYTKVKNAMTSEVQTLKLLPFSEARFDIDGEKEIKNIEFFPTPNDVLNTVVPNYLIGIIYGCLVESFYSEHNERMMAMKNATDSADSMLEELNMTYNRVRQANITQELTEVVAGANAQQRK